MTTEYVLATPDLDDRGVAAANNLEHRKNKESAAIGLHLGVIYTIPESACQNDGCTLTPRNVSFVRGSIEFVTHAHVSEKLPPGEKQRVIDNINLVNTKRLSLGPGDHLPVARWMVPNYFRNVINEIIVLEYGWAGYQTRLLQDRYGRRIYDSAPQPWSPPKDGI